MHDNTLPKTEQAPGDLIQDEPLLTYQPLPPANEDPLAALMSRMPDEASFCAPTLQALFFDAQQHNSVLHQAEAATTAANTTESANKTAAVSASASARPIIHCITLTRMGATLFASKLPSWLLSNMPLWSRRCKTGAAAIRIVILRKKYAP